MRTSFRKTRLAAMAVILAGAASLSQAQPAPAFDDLPCSDTDWCNVDNGVDSDCQTQTTTDHNMCGGGAMQCGIDELTGEMHFWGWCYDNGDTDCPLPEFCT